MNPSTLTPERIAIAILDGELRTLKSIAERCPRQDGSGLLGVNSGTAWQWLKRGNLRLETAVVDGVTFYFIDIADQHRPDWGLGGKFKRRRTGRPTHQEAMLVW